MADYKWPKASKKLSAEERRDLVARVREGIEDVSVFELENRREAEIDLQFVAGDQWPAAVKTERSNPLEQRPMLTLNQLPQFVQLITNPIRQADIGMKAVPVDDNADVATAKIIDGLFKKIQYDCQAKKVYVNGNEHQTKCGIGWWRVCTDYASDEVFEQDIKIKRINNPLAVYCDPAAVEPTREDAMWMAVVEAWPRKTFKKRYPGAAEVSVDMPDNQGTPSHGFEWGTKDTVAVAEWYEKVPAKKTIALMADGSSRDITGKGEAELGQLDQEMQILRTREVDTYQVKKYLVTGSDVLEGPVDWPGSYIPLIPVIGSETPRKTGTLRFGMVRFARDPQQLLNFYETAAAEAIALAPKAPYISTARKIKNYLDEWTTANRKNRPFLRYDADPDDPGPPKREHPPETPEALIRQTIAATEHLQRMTGVYPSALGARSNETSGVAIGARQEQTDTANGHFADNLYDAVTYTARVVMDLIPHIYDTERALRLIGEDDKEFSVVINKVLYSVNGQDVVSNDLSVGKYDVRVTFGKNYLTKRIEAVTAMVELAKTLPPQAQLAMLDLIVGSMDWPNADKLAKRLRNMIPPGVLADPDDPNAPKPPGPEDDPMLVAKLEELEAKIKDLQASARLKDAQAEGELVKAGVADTETNLAVHAQLMEDWQAGHPSPGTAPPQGQPPQPEQQQIPEPPAGFKGGSLQAPQRPQPPQA